MNRRLTNRAATAPRRGLSRDEAALFVGFSPAVFDRMVEDGRMPKPTTLDGEEVFDLIQIDRAFERLCGGQPERNPWK